MSALFILDGVDVAVWLWLGRFVVVEDDWPVQVNLLRVVHALLAEHLHQAQGGLSGQGTVGS